MEENRALVDADFFVALYKETDSNHLKAINIAQMYKGYSLFVSEMAIPEAATVISHKISQSDAIEFLKRVRTEDYYRVGIDLELEKMADDVFKKQTKKGTSWPDCLNIAIAKKLKITEIFSFDEVYSRNGLKLLGW